MTLKATLTKMILLKKQHFKTTLFVVIKYLIIKVSIHKEANSVPYNSIVNDYR